MKNTNKNHNYLNRMKNIAKKALESYAYSMNMCAKYCPDHGYLNYPTYM